MCVHTETYAQTFTLIYTTETHFFLKRTKVNHKEVEKRIVVISQARVLGKTGECLLHGGRFVRTQGCLSLDENDNF